VFTEATAKRLLCLVTTPDRAEAILGDLTEISSSRGPVWFWSQWSRALAAHAFKAVTSAPLRFILLAVGGISIHTFISMTMLELAAITDYVAYLDPSDLQASLSLLPSVFWLSLVFFAFVGNLMTGFLLGRFASTRGLNGITPFLTVQIANWVLYPVVGTFVFSLPWAVVGAGVLLLPFVSIFPLLVGGVTANRKIT